MISIELEQEVWHLLNDGKSVKEIASVTGVSEGTIRTIERQPTLRSLTRKRVFFASIEHGLKEPAKCPDCGGHINQWPCLLCHPKGRRDIAGYLKPEDEGTVVKHGMQVSGHVIMPRTQKIILLVRVARNLIEMQKEKLLTCDSVLLRHLVRDAKVALLVTEEEEENGKRISSENEGTR